MDHEARRRGTRRKRPTVSFKRGTIARPATRCRVDPRIDRPGARARANLKTFAAAPRTAARGDAQADLRDDAAPPGGARAAVPHLDVARQAVGRSRSGRAHGVGRGRAADAPGVAGRCARGARRGTTTSSTPTIRTWPTGWSGRSARRSGGDGTNPRRPRGLIGNDAREREHAFAGVDEGQGAGDRQQGRTKDVREVWPAEEDGVGPADPHERSRIGDADEHGRAGFDRALHDREVPRHRRGERSPEWRKVPLWSPASHLANACGSTS